MTITMKTRVIITLCALAATQLAAASGNLLQFFWRAVEQGKKVSLGHIDSCLSYR